MARGPALAGAGGAWVSTASSSDLGSVIESDIGARTMAGAMLPATPHRQSLLALLGAPGLKVLASAVGPGGAGPGESTALVFTQVLKVIAALQRRLQESEAMVAELQAKADDSEEQRRILARRADRAERGRDEAARRCEAAEAAARNAKLEATPVVERYMEAQVLRSQLEAANEELQRLRDEAATCREELRQGWPRLSEAGDAEAECETAISELQSAHTEEVAVLKSLHVEELSEIRSQHAARFAELEAARCEEVGQLKMAHSEELGSLRAALDTARWQADVYVREQQDAVREVCLRQRENARIAKRHAEARHEAMELSVRLEAARAMEAGAPAREAELQAVRHRYALLHQTKLEWQEALERKRADCENWRRRAVQRGAAAPEERDELEEEAFSDTGGARPPSPSSSVAASAAAGAGAGGAGAAPSEAEHGPSATPRSATPLGTPLQTPQPRRRTLGFGQRPSPAPPHPGGPPQMPPSRRRLSAHGGGRPALGIGGAPPLALGPPPLPEGEDGLSSLLPAPAEPSRRQPEREAFGERGSRSRRGRPGIPQPPPVLALPAPDEDDNVAGPLSLAEGPSAEYLSAAVRLAMLQVDAEMSRGGAGGHLNVAIQEAENELEMAAFLLDEGGAAEVQELLELEAQRRPPRVALRLRELQEELSARGRQQRGAPRSFGQAQLFY